MINDRPVPISVREMQPHDADAWQAFVDGHPEANLYHTLAWQEVVAEVFGHRPVYLIAERAGDVCGILPMFLVRAPLLGTKLVSLPYDIGSGGAVAMDAEVERELAQKAIAIARAYRVNYLEIRAGTPRPALQTLGFRVTEPVVISEMALEDEATVWAAVAEDHRKAMGKARRRGVVIREGTTAEDFRMFWDVYCRVFRDFGTPPYGDRYFPVVRQRLQPSGAARLLLAFAESRCVGGLLLYCWRRNVVSKFAACLPEAVALRAYAALYGRAIELAIAGGYTRLSWGTSARDQTGLIEFKERWGARTRPATLYAMPVRGSVPNIEAYYDSNTWTRRAWRHLPLPLTRVGGALLNRWYC